MGEKKQSMSTLSNCSSRTKNTEARKLQKKYQKLSEGYQSVRTHEMHRKVDAIDL